MGDRSVLVGVDIGGTFTDVVVAVSGEPLVLGKYLTTHDDPTRAVVEGIADLLERTDTDPGRVIRVAHATTLATNTILERRGVDVAFITTRGFRDMLTLGRGARVEEERFDIMFDVAPPPIPPERCFEVAERLGPDGRVIAPLDEEDVRRVVKEIADTAAEAVAICLLHSYANPDHEERVAEICRSLLPGRSVVASASVWPEMREYERATTTLMSAYVGPIMERYLVQLAEQLANIGVTAPLHVMESSGGVMSAELAAQRAVYTIESGPAAGVMAALHIGAAADAGDVISFDMGGTTAKAGVIRGGNVEITRSFHVGGSGSFGGRREGSGVPIKAPAIDLAEVGSGGGSIAWVDDGGALRVGPQSAGSDPGPACYGLGGRQATVTDANLVLGYLDPRRFAGGSMQLSVEAAAAAIDGLAAELGAERLEAAYAVHEIANANMGTAVHVVTVQRGIDPRRFTMVGFGGAGPMHAARIAQRFGIERVLIPSGCGVASAIGLLTTDLVVERARTMVQPAASPDLTAVGALLSELAQAAATDLSLTRDEIEVRYAVDARYVGQSHELTVDLPSTAVTEAAVAAAVEAFHDRYDEAYGATARGTVELVGWRARVIRPVAKVDASGSTSTSDVQAAEPGQRPAYFPEAGGLVDVPVWDRAGLPAAGFAGPGFVEEAESTTVVPVGWSIRTGVGGVLALERSA